jgi:hypothetical protein
MPNDDDDIEVTFIDAASGQAFERVQVPSNQLPESFELATTLHLGQLEWRVEAAEPATRAEYSSSKKLVLRLRKVELRLDPNQILFSLSTIEDALPASTGDPTSGDELVLHEDDWRQLELVSRAHEDALDQELDAIGDIHLNHRAGRGYRQLHRRQRIPNPLLPNTVRIEHLGGLSTKSVAFRGTGRRIRNSFVRELGANATLYGIQEGGEVRVLCLQVEGALEDEALQLLERLQREHALIFVDWCSCRTGMRAFFQDG